MKTCFDCGLPIHISVPLFDSMPVYCPLCLFELRVRIVKDLDEQGHLEAYRRVALPSRDEYGSYPSERVKAHA